MQSRQERVDEILGEALMLPAAKRAEFLQTRCPGDSALRDEVSALLEQDARLGKDFLRPPPANPAFERILRMDGPDPLIKKTIGAYTIQSVIARGGMGTVYLAEQENPRRPVALKIMHPGLWSRASKRRFEVESQILAYLRHPNIAQVFEAGVHRQEAGATLRYFAMEYVPNARKITEYANERSQSLLQRLELFLQLCDAVQHGHQKGIIHRDLKPTNILVDGDDAQNGAATVRERCATLPDGRGSDAVVKVIDFGIARSTDSDFAKTTMHTEAGQLLGTLAYMSPEQCAADPSQIDTTTDIYSLGVILFELLTGRMPYDVSNTTIHAAARIICEREPARPSAFDRCLRGDVETIILKAIEKDRTKRYPSISDLSADIKRYLVGEPISARPPTRFQRLLRWAGKHPTRAAAISSISVVLLTAVSTMFVWYIVGQRPDRIEMADDQTEVRLLSLAGTRLHRWEAVKGNIIVFAEETRQPEQFGSRRLALLGFDNLKVTNLGRVSAFDMDGDWNKPVWDVRLSEEDFPDELVKLGPQDWGFSPRSVAVADIFPDSQSYGPEIAVTFVHQYSRSALCIFDSRGELLYRVWNDGGFGAMHWLARPGLLICTGGDETVKKSMGSLGVSFIPVLLALRPAIGIHSREYLGNKPGTGREGLAWYKYVFPPVTRGFSFSPTLSSKVGLMDQERVFRFTYELVLPIAGAQKAKIVTPNFIVNEQGRVVDGSRRMGDSFYNHRNQLPSIETFQLRDEPPTAADVWSPP